MISNNTGLWNITIYLIVCMKTLYRIAMASIFVTYGGEIFKMAVDNNSGERSDEHSSQLQHNPEHRPHSTPLTNINTIDSPPAYDDVVPPFPSISAYKPEGDLPTYQDLYPPVGAIKK